MGDVTGTTSFTIVTTPTDGAFGTEGSSKTLSNDVELNSTASVDPLDSTNATVSVTTDWVQKTGVARSQGGVNYIDWTIKLNNNNRTIPAGATLTDTIPQYLTLDASSVRRNGALPETFGDTSSLSGQNLTYTFGSAAAGVQTITFTTSVDDAYYSQQGTTGFRNTGVLNIDGSSYPQQSGNVGIGTSLLAKTGQGYDRANQLITWRLEVNRNGRAITGAIITDTIGSNQEFDPAFGVTRRDGTTTVPLAAVASFDDVTSQDGQYFYNSDTKVLTVYLGDLAASEHPYITFKTKVANPNDYANNKTTSYRNNSASLSGGGITTSTVTNTGQNVVSEVLTKTGTGYDYTDRKLSWTITVNQNNMHMPNAVVVDTIQDGQAYVDGSLLIDGAVPGTRLNQDGNTLTITLGEITAQTVITFQTVVTDLSVFLTNNENVTFRNKADLTTGIPSSPTVTVWGERDVDNKAIEKGLGVEYTPENGYIGWDVYINANQAPIENTILTDTLQKGLELDNESVKLYFWNQDSSGSRSVGELVPTSQYSFTYNYDTRVFNLALPDGAQGYYLTFNTDVLEPGK
ncbi:MAG: collagen binding domain-containing protein [Christensenellales bacterium]